MYNTAQYVGKVRSCAVISSLRRDSGDILIKKSVRLLQILTKWYKIVICIVNGIRNCAFSVVYYGSPLSKRKY